MPIHIEFQFPKLPNVTTLTHLSLLVPYVEEKIDEYQISWSIFLICFILIVMTTLFFNSAYLGFNGEVFFEYKQYWSLLTFHFVHGSISHFLVNMYSLWLVSSLEKDLGRTRYIVYIAILMLVSPFVDDFIRRKFNINLNKFVSVGFSGVLFGLITIKSNLEGRIPFSLRPFISLGIISFVSPGSSFIGHLSGIIVGTVLSWIHFII